MRRGIHTRRRIHHNLKKRCARAEDTDMRLFLGASNLHTCCIIIRQQHISNTYNTYKNTLATHQQHLSNTLAAPETVCPSRLEPTHQQYISNTLATHQQHFSYVYFTLILMIIIIIGMIVCTHLYVYTCTHIYTYIHAHTFICIYMHTHLYVYTRIHIYMHIHAYTFIRMSVHTQLYVYTCIRDLVVLFNLLEEIVRAHAAVDTEALPNILKSQCPSKP